MQKQSVPWKSRKNTQNILHCLKNEFYIKYFSSTYFVFFNRSQRLFPAALVFLILIALTNYIMIFFSCHGLHTYGPWLNKYHKVDLWLHRVLVRDFKLMFKIFHTVNTVHVLFHGSTLQDMCRCLDCRFRTVLLYTQHGQPSHPWLTWTLCSSMTQMCPKHTVPPSHCPF